jgi:hypothetical protein
LEVGTQFSGDLLQKRESASGNSYEGKGQIRMVGKFIKIRRKVLSKVIMNLVFVILSASEGSLLVEQKRSFCSFTKFTLERSEGFRTQSLP